jgi:dihydroxy-acid dehydratase
MLKFAGRARVFDVAEKALKAIYQKEIKPGDALVIRYQGPRSNGMPELFYITEAISSDKTLNRNVALITDGRFSGGSKGPCIGHVSPEAADRGPIAVIEDGDRILIDVEIGRLDLIGTGEREHTPTQVKRILKKRLEKLPEYKPPERAGLLGLYTGRCAAAHLGAYLR